MDKKNDGGPAFPIKGYCADASGALCGEVVKAEGMTLRDYFAAKAMQGMMANCWNKNYDAWAVEAYKLADAMLKARDA